MTVKTYDPKAVQVIIGGQQMSGFADGDFINVERDADMFTKHIGADGEGSRAKSNDKSGRLTLTLAQTSASNDILAVIAQADELSNTGVVPVLIKDTLGTSTLFAGHGWIVKQPAYTAGKEIGDREWMVDMARIDIFIGGNNAA